MARFLSNRRASFHLYLQRFLWLLQWRWTIVQCLSQMSRAMDSASKAVQLRDRACKGSQCNRTCPTRGNGATCQEHYPIVHASTHVPSLRTIDTASPLLWLLQGWGRAVLELQLAATRTLDRSGLPTRRCLNITIIIQGAPGWHHPSGNCVSYLVDQPANETAE